MVEPQGLEVAADWRTLRSPETYLGYGQSDGLRVAERPAVRPAARLPARRLGCRLNEWALTGDLDASRQHAAVLERAGRRGSRSGSTPATSTS